MISGRCVNPRMNVSINAGNPLAKTKKPILSIAPMLNLTNAIGTTGWITIVGLSINTEKAVSAWAKTP